MEKKEIKKDLIELSNIKYGLFNVDEWKKILSEIIAKKIDAFELKGKSRPQLKKEISKFLYKAISDFEKGYYEKNSSGIEGFFKTEVAKVTDIFGRLKQDIPNITNQILNFLNDSKNKKALKFYLTSKLNDYTDSTFSKLDYSIHNSILANYKMVDRRSTINLLNTKLESLEQQSVLYKYILVLLSVLTATFIFYEKKLQKTEVLLLTIMCSLFLILGLTLPMIEIDARIAEIKMSLLGEQIKFQDQVLYYKSKSILEVVQLMLTNKSFDLVLVGLLLFVFSVLFPFSKLISTVYLLTHSDLQSNKVLNFLVYKTGKWSMADVLVVAIFMSYIGFSGILTEQLNQLDRISTTIEIISTNKSNLQIGFFAFTSFVLLSLLITGKLKETLGDESEKNEKTRSII